MLEKHPEQAAQSAGSAQSIDHHSEAEERLASVLRRVYGARRVEIEELKTKGAAIWAEPNFIWERLLEAFSTMGNARGVKLVRDSSLHELVSYPSLLALAPDQRLLVLTRTLRTAVVRMPDRKAAWLLMNFDRIQADGGPDIIKQRLAALVGRDQKIRYLRSFIGIGEKYARNMMMDAYHPEFRNSIAFDVRVKKIAEALEMKFATYDAAEQFFISAAARSGLNGWELDRVLYHFTNEVLRSLSA